MVDSKCVGAVVSKLDMHKKTIRRGYIAMLAVEKDYRKRGIGNTAYQILTISPQTILRILLQ